VLEQVEILAKENTIIFGILSSIIGGFILLVFQGYFTHLISLTNPFSGVWHNEILDDKGNVIKRDVIIMKHRRNEIFGKIRREYPADQKHRRYHFRGHVRGESMLAIFWSDDLGVNSYGSWHVEHTRDFLYEGYYLSKSSVENSKQIIAIPLRQFKPPKVPLTAKLRNFLKL
jgi:hypothetical protein